jgi:hypothetical protein
MLVTIAPADGSYTGAGSEDRATVRGNDRSARTGRDLDVEPGQHRGPRRVVLEHETDFLVGSRAWQVVVFSDGVELRQLRSFHVVSGNAVTVFALDCIGERFDGIGTPDFVVRTELVGFSDQAFLVARDVDRVADFEGRLVDVFGEFRGVADVDARVDIARDLIV